MAPPVTPDFDGMIPSSFPPGGLARLQARGRVLEPRIGTLQTLLEELDQGVTLVTANARLATALRQAHDRLSLDRGELVWSSPDLLPWSRWLQRCREEQLLAPGAPPPALLLSDAQELLLWERVIQASAGNVLLQVPATARRAREAAERLLAWRLDDARLAAAAQNEDSQAFRTWWREVRHTCQREHWLLPAQLADHLFLAPEAPSVPARLLLVGFDELTPQQAHLIERLRSAGCVVEWFAFEALPAAPLLHVCADAREEALRAARWARAQLERNPAARIAIVVPDLQAMRPALVQALDSVLLPPALQPQEWQRVRPYNLSLGLPLSDHALVQSAFDGLALLDRAIALDSVSRLLRSPFLAGWEEEGAARALLDARLRQRGELQVTLSTLHYEARREDRPWHCPGLATALARLRESAKGLQGRRSPGAWVEGFSTWLRELGWAQGRSLSSAEYQTRQAWRELLASLAGLEPLEPRLERAAALHRLQRLAAARLFQPETPDVPLQVLGVLETSGLQFDHLWVMGLHDGVWPAAPRPNPFLPLALQRELGLPHASAERELEVARRTTARLLGSAHEVLVSVPRNEGDRPLRASPLLEGLPLVAVEALELWGEPLWRERLFAARATETLTPDPAPPVDALQARGGSAVFKYQAACPFRAFAELRLGARPLEQAEIGLDARTRGSLLHRILEKLWQVLGNQAGLLARAEEELRVLVGEVVAQELERVEQQHPFTMTPRFREVEAQRLQRLVLDWLALDRNRAPFRAVEPEQEYPVLLGGIEVRIKIDRIDTLEDGRKLLIDYKTGKVEARQWFGERPEEPQLPLYSAALTEPVAGLLIAQLQTGGLGFNGVLEEAGLVPGVKAFSQLKQCREQADWAALLADWRATLEALGAAFHDGQAQVDPRDYPNTCQYCTLTPLCRIQEQVTLAPEPEGDGDD